MESDAGKRELIYSFDGLWVRTDEGVWEPVGTRNEEYWKQFINMDRQGKPSTPKDEEEQAIDTLSQLGEPPFLLQELSDAVNSFTRRKIKEDSLFRLIMSPLPIGEP
jgi:hypothetical protein